jgi:hypothetical protein
VYIAFSAVPAPNANAETTYPQSGLELRAARGTDNNLAYSMFMDSPVTSLSPIVKTIKIPVFYQASSVAGIFSLVPTTFARRIANTGNTYITGSFDEYTKIS